MPPTCSSRPLSNGSLRCIGATTTTSSAASSKDNALSRRFQKIDVAEPTVEQTVEIPQGAGNRALRPTTASVHRRRADHRCRAGRAHINDRHLPDKAIDVIDEAGAAQKILPKSRQKKVINKTEIEDIITKIARIPAKTVSNDDRSALKTLDRDLKTWCFGQDAAIDALAAAIKMSRSGLATRPSRLAPSCSPARPGWARPKWPSSWPTRWRGAAAL